MKLIYTLISSFLLSQAFAQTNVYHPFPEDSATWSVSWHGQPPTCNGYCHTEVFRMYGDTMINSVSYNKLWREYYIYNGPYTPPSNFVPSIYWGGIRQDSLQKKVYFLGPTMSTDTLLYDFDLNIGDTLPASYLNNSIGPPAIVLGIDSIKVGNNYHKAFLFTSMPISISYAYLLEGVGAGGGLFDLLSFFEYGPILDCFSGTMLPDGNYYPNSKDCGWLVTGIDSEERSDLFEIIPNPFKDNFQLKSTLINSQVVIENIFGQKIFQTKTISEETEINLEDQQNGIYFFILRSKDKTITKKLVKN